MAVVGIATVIVLFLQYDTLDKTDHTLREGQRAFVFFRELARGQTVEKDQSTIWTFIPNLENNGNTQTKKALIGISCEKSGIQKFYDGYLKPDGPRVFGPKQIIGAGGCSWTSTFLDQQRLSRTPSYIGGVVEYEDIFGGRHVTKYCRQLYVLSDPNPKGINLEHITGLCPDTPDCADEECKSQK